MWYHMAAAAANQTIVDDIACTIGTKACQALLEEVYTTPKPGLVDPYSAGAHNDMDVHTFERSAWALLPWFTKMAVQGYMLQGSPEELFLAIRKTGMLAEQAMYRATDYVNTHKGLIFTMGIFSAAAGRCLRLYHQITLDNLIDMERQMTSDILSNELQKIMSLKATSNGEKNLQQYGAAGIRGEAIQGYPSVVSLALPVLWAGLKERRNWNQIKLQTLFVLMSQVQDSNIISRHDPETLAVVQEEARGFLSRGGAYSKQAITELIQMDTDYIKRNISAGGCADLLATAIFLNMLTTD